MLHLLPRKSEFKSSNFSLKLTHLLSKITHRHPLRFHFRYRRNIPYTVSIVLNRTELKSELLAWEAIHEGKCPPRAQGVEEGGGSIPWPATSSTEGSDPSLVASVTLDGEPLHGVWSGETQCSCVSLGERDSSLTNARCHGEKSLESVSGMHVVDEERTEILFSLPSLYDFPTFSLRSPPSHLLRSRFRHHRRTPGDKDFNDHLCGCEQKEKPLQRTELMAPTPPSQPTERDASDHNRLLKSVIGVLQQQNAALEQQITIVLQRTSTSYGNKRTEWSLESFLRHHPSKFNEKCLPGELEKVNALKKNVTVVEQHMKQQQQVVRGTTSSRNNTNSRRTRRTPYARTELPSISSGSQAQPWVATNRSEQKKTIKCFKCGGPHFRSSCPQLVEAKYCLQCGGSGHVKNECNMGERAGLGPPNAGRGQQGRGGRAQVG
ncbi:hypothetical protein LR48_Vigan525s000200 [Vigna angularis]|uniref:CCHC-type domain-containing protein n=1 Tax=Phaseolus angularis TaxID=3914 RepID=A0A0L9TDU3_PHAAN|nr:hypothetical protein LR48_Vigan525s000200 [Vigna angularis]